MNNFPVVSKNDRSSESTLNCFSPNAMAIVVIRYGFGKEFVSGQ